MHSLQEILMETRKDSKLCNAIETGGIICFRVVDCKGVCQKHYERYKKYKSYDLPNKEIKKCKFIDCNDKYHAKDYCRKHYNKYLNTKLSKINYGKFKCSVLDCCKKRKNKMYCSMHLERLRVHKDLNVKKETGLKKAQKKALEYWKNRQKKICIVPKCNNEYCAKGLCKKHYNYWYMWGDYKISSKKEYLEKLKIN